MAKISAIVLAAGLSRRMGKKNKLFLPIQGKPMIDWVIENVAAAKADEAIIVGSEKSVNQLQKWASGKVRLVENKAYKTGMTSSIQAGVSGASGDGYMICLGDQPSIKTSTYDRLIAAFQAGADDIILPFFEGRRGSPALFARHYREAILTHQEPEGCRAIIEKNMRKVKKVAVDDPGVLMDIDTREDYFTWSP